MRVGIRGDERGNRIGTADAKRNIRTLMRKSGVRISDRYSIRHHQRQVFSVVIQFEVRMQFSPGDHAVLTGSKDNEKSAGRKIGGRKRPLRQIGA